MIVKSVLPLTVFAQFVFMMFPVFSRAETIAGMEARIADEQTCASRAYNIAKHDCAKQIPEDFIKQGDCVKAANKKLEMQCLKEMKAENIKSKPKQIPVFNKSTLDNL